MLSSAKAGARNRGILVGTDDCIDRIGFIVMFEMDFDVQTSDTIEC